MENAIELLNAELEAANALIAKLADRIEALEARADYHAGHLVFHDDRLRALELDAELSKGTWEPDVQWHKDNGYQL
jgi:hypothetical protein